MILFCLGKMFHAFSFCLGKTYNTLKYSEIQNLLRQNLSFAVLLRQKFVTH